MSKVVITDAVLYKIVVQYGDNEPQTHEFKWTGCVRFNEAKRAEEFLFECVCGACPKDDNQFVLTADELVTLSDGRVTRIPLQ